MEQHMYQYLNQKFGLKSLTIEYASAIINGIKEYSKKDMNLIISLKILFMKILIIVLVYGLLLVFMMRMIRKKKERLLKKK